MAKRARRFGISRQCPYRDISSIGNGRLWHWPPAGCGKSTHGQAWDLKQVVVALPGGRAGRRLLERMVQLASERKAIFTPPRIVTVGHLPELLYEVKKPLAGKLARELAWIEAIRRSPPERIERLVPRRPADDDLAGWRSLARMLDRLHTELAADRLDFAQVERKGSTLADFDEAQRWQASARFNSTI